MGSGFLIVGWGGGVSFGSQQKYSASYVRIFEYHNYISTVFISKVQAVFKVQIPSEVEFAFKRDYFSLAA